MLALNSKESATPVGKPVAKYVSFRLLGVSVGIEASVVREIVPHIRIDIREATSTGWRGIIVFRGAAVPVIDLRRLCEPACSLRGEDCVTVVEVKLADGGMATLGLITDEPEEMVNVDEKQIERVTGEVVARLGHYVAGVAHTRSGDKTLLCFDGLIERSAWEETRNAA